MNGEVKAEQAPASILERLEAARSVAVIDDVLVVMRDLDAFLPPDDGLKWFNLLYEMVTQAVHGELVAGTWGDAPWLAKLDVVFARFYFDALYRWHKQPKSAPRAWRALLEARYRGGVHRVQFALAGMNAHINHDLPLAVVETCSLLAIDPERGSPQFEDFERVNSILASVEPRALDHLATGIVGLVAQEMGMLGHVLSMWSVRHARDTAWTNATVLWDIRDLPRLRNRILLAMDRMTGFAGRGLVLPIV